MIIFNSYVSHYQRVVGLNHSPAALYPYGSTLRQSTVAGKSPIYRGYVIQKRLLTYQREYYHMIMLHIFNIFPNYPKLSHNISQGGLPPCSWINQSPTAKSRIMHQYKPLPVLGWILDINDAHTMDEYHSIPT